MSQSYFKIDQFDLASSVSAGGITGSSKVKAGGVSYQLKPSILDAKSTRKLKAGGVDRENFGEVIAATMSRAISGADQVGATELVPEVSLVHDVKNERVLIASKYLDNVQDGTLDDYAQKSRGVKTKKRHVKVSAKGPAPDTLDLRGDPLLRQDLANAFALSALSGDHDVNPGNMVVVRDKDNNTRVARIDFGHAFNDLLNAPKAFGGQVRNKGNQILDFLNRETVSDLRPNSRQAKLWRDYDGIVPSAELAKAFKEMSESKGVTYGIEQAKKSFGDLVNELLEDPQGNKEVIEHVKNSLIAINNNVSDVKIDPKKVNVYEAMQSTFKNLETFYNKGQEQMKDVAKLMDMQVKVDKLVRAHKKKEPLTQETKALLQEVEKAYKELEGAQGIGLGAGKGIEWVKSDKNSKPFKGTLDEFIKQRGQDLGLQTAQPTRGQDIAIQDIKPQVRPIIEDMSEHLIPSESAGKKSSLLSQIRNDLKPMKAVVKAAKKVASFVNKVTSRKNKGGYDLFH